jgi:hypothetical protein
MVCVAGNIVSAPICRMCTWWQHPPENPRPFPAISGKRREGPCMFLGDVIDERLCESCRGAVRIKVYECLHPQHDETTIRDCERCFDYEPRLQAGGVATWAIGVTVAPRRQPTLARCLTGLAAAGWLAPRIFAEPGVEIPPGFEHLPLTRRDSTLGPWPNWYLGLAELFQRDPSADAYLMVQDDALLCRNVRALLEKNLWPAPKVGVISVYCPGSYRSGVRGFFEVESRMGLIGALTYAFPNASVRSILSHAPTLAHRLRGPAAGIRQIDSVVGWWAHDRKLPVFYHSPSLAQHVSVDSTIWPTQEAFGARRAADFVGEGFDATALFASV